MESMPHASSEEEIWKTLTDSIYIESYDTRDFDENNSQIFTKMKSMNTVILDSNESNVLNHSEELFGFKVSETIKYAKEIDLASQTISSICNSRLTPIINSSPDDIVTFNKE